MSELNRSLLHLGGGIFIGNLLSLAFVPFAIVAVGCLYQAATLLAVAATFRRFM